MKLKINQPLFQHNEENFEPVKTFYKYALEDIFFYIK